MKIVKHSVYEEMYYLEWPDGSRSDDFYNISRAHDFSRRIEETTARRERERAAERPPSPAGALK